MGLYVIKNGDGEYVHAMEGGTHNFEDLSHAFIYRKWEPANSDAKKYGGHVVPLGEARDRIAVTKEEADDLTNLAIRARENEANGTPLNVRINDAKMLRAYAAGWYVPKPKKYVLPMPDGTDDGVEMDDMYYAVKKSVTGKIVPTWVWRESDNYESREGAAELYAYTADEIAKAPKWVRDLDRVEVENDD